MRAIAHRLVRIFRAGELAEILWLVIRDVVTGMSAEKLALRSIGLNAAVRAARFAVS